MEAKLDNTSLIKLKQRLKVFLVIVFLFVLMSWYEPFYEVYKAFYLKVIKFIWAFLNGFIRGKLHLIVLVIVGINLIRLFMGNSVKEFFIKLSSGVLYFINAFFILWGFNYAQPTLPEASKLEQSQLIDLNEKALLQMNELRVQVSDSSYLKGNSIDKQSNIDLHTLLKVKTQELIPSSRFYTRPVPFFNSGTLRKMGIGGIYFPFSGEALYDDSSPELRQTFTYAHEYFHAQSVTGEDECNYLAWSVLVQSGKKEWMYSAYFDLYFTTARLLGKSSEEMQAEVYSLVWEDVMYLREERQAYDTWFHSVSAATNDSYLKLLSSSEGTAAYEGYVKWVYVDLLTASR